MSTAPTARLNAALNGRYQVEREIGEGGMATVYLARDQRHNRNVALKLLKPELAAVVGEERFLAEIQTTANLQHPNIVPLFDSGAANGFLYYVMPYIEGESLRDRLERERRLPVDEVIRIASDVAEALQSAHDQGVVHRDIKPANVLLSRGRALVADFGIARVASAAERTRLTQAGSSLGTAGYMSPEQALGSDEVNAQSDIYSLGCMVFEMLTGQVPYTGPTLLAVIAKQATEPVPRVRALRPDVPAAVERCIALALAKEPGERTPSATDFAASLVVESTKAPAEKTMKAVVVLPFTNSSADADNEYFSDGLTEEVISDLSRVSALRVISRNSAMALKGTTKDSRTLGQELGVTHLVTGAVRRAGTALRVTAELVEISTDASIWSDKFTGTVEDVFGIQEEISQHIVAALEIRLTKTEERQVKTHAFDDPVAYDCYLRARQMMYDWTPDAPRQAMRLVDEAMALVGRTPLLLATRGQIIWSMVNMALVPAEEALPRAMEHVEEALSIDPSSALAIFVRGLIAAVRGEREIALKDLYRAHELEPGDANILGEMCRFSTSSGLRNHGPYVDLCMKLDPLTPVMSLVVSTHRWLNGPHEEAAPPARRAMELAPSASALHFYAAWHIAFAGFREEACDVFDRVARAMPDDVHGVSSRFIAATLRGDRETALTVITPEVEDRVRDEHMCHMLTACHALMGAHDEALRWMRKSIESGFLHYPFLAHGDPFLASLRGHPGFEEVLAEVKPRWERLVAWEDGLGVGVV